MAYTIGGIEFSKKSEITEKCSGILNTTADGMSVFADNLEFLFALFEFHDEWGQKSDGGVVDISSQTTDHGTRCFTLLNSSGESIDISFHHAIKLIPTNRTKSLIPQKLIDFKNAARSAIKDQITAFRETNLANTTNCSVTGVEINRVNCQVDHIPPTTFDQLLLDFILSKDINPLTVNVVSTNGVVAEFDDEELKSIWQEYHLQNANLRILSRTGNLQLPKTRVDWSQAIEQ